MLRLHKYNDCMDYTKRETKIIFIIFFWSIWWKNLRFELLIYSKAKLKTGLTIFITGISLSIQMYNFLFKKWWWLIIW
jgi:hypothetical protein